MLLPCGHDATRARRRQPISSSLQNFPSATNAGASSLVRSTRGTPRVRSSPRGERSFHLACARASEGPARPGSGSSAGGRERAPIYHVRRSRDRSFTCPFPCPFACQDSNGLRLHHHRVLRACHAMAIFNTSLLRVRNDAAMHPLERLGAHTLERALERGCERQICRFPACMAA